jgi:hypothetical protein
MGLLVSLDGLVPFVRPDLDVTDARGAVAARLSAPGAGAILGVGVDFR